MPTDTETVNGRTRKKRKPPKRGARSKRGAVEGRPPFEPSDRQRQIVRALAVANFTHEQICKAVRNPQTNAAITKPTLELHFREELDLSFFESAALVVSDFMRKCTGASAVIDKESGMIVRDEVKSDTKAQIFFLSARLKDMGWSTRIEHTGKDGKDIFAMLAAADLAKLNDKQLNAFEDILRSLDPAVPGA